jgi:hypothetical protein
MSDMFLEPCPFAALWTYSDLQAHRMAGGFSTNRKEINVSRIAIVAGATLAMLTAAGAADLPHRQPVYQQAQIGKMPIGKSPLGKAPIGKTPVGKGPVAARY